MRCSYKLGLPQDNSFIMDPYGNYINRSYGKILNNLIHHYLVLTKNQYEEYQFIRKYAILNKNSLNDYLFPNRYCSTWMNDEVLYQTMQHSKIFDNRDLINYINDPNNIRSRYDKFNLSGELTDNIRLSKVTDYIIEKLFLPKNMSLYPSLVDTTVVPFTIKLLSDTINNREDKTLLQNILVLDSKETLNNLNSDISRIRTNLEAEYAYVPSQLSLTGIITTCNPKHSILDIDPSLLPKNNSNQARKEYRDTKFMLYKNNVNHNGYVRVCPTCGTKFIVNNINSDQLACSLKCQNDFAVKSAEMLVKLARNELSDDSTFFSRQQEVCNQLHNERIQENIDPNNKRAMLNNEFTLVNLPPEHFKTIYVNTNGNVTQIANYFNTTPDVVERLCDSYNVFTKQNKLLTSPTLVQSLLDQGYSINQIANIFHKPRVSIQRFINECKSQGLIR